MGVTSIGTPSQFTKNLRISVPECLIYLALNFDPPNFFTTSVFNDQFYSKGSTSTILSTENPSKMEF